jgi:predicted RNase H-like nuclease
LRALGVDACKGGWVALLLDDGDISAVLCRRLDELPSADVVAIDIPLGLVTSGWRTCDALVAAQLGPRRSSVFITPVRAALECDDYVEACAISLAASGMKISKQAHGLRHRILEADAWRSTRREPVREAHPELCFATMRGATLEWSKRTWSGIELRRRLLAQHGIEIPAELGLAGAAGVDDVLDAGACAWTATRILEGVATSLPDPPQHGSIAVWV